LPKWSEKARDEIELMASWFDKKKADEHLVRPHFTSNWNPIVEDTRAQARLVLAGLFIRELPIKNFYVRSTIMYFYFTWFFYRMLGKGFRNTRPVVFYNNDHASKTLLNYPELFWFNMVRVLPTVPLTPHVSKEWQLRQQPVFHQYHRNVYRYRFRKPRYVPWDGT